MPYSYPPHYYEDFEVGQTFETIGRTITEADVTNQAALSGDWTEYHTNEEYASDRLFGERIAQGPLTFSVSLGLMTNSGVLTRTSAGLAGMDETRFPNPLRIDDTVSVDLTVVDKRDVDREDAGIVVLQLVTTTQNGDVVFETTLTMFVRRRPDGE